MDEVTAFHHYCDSTLIPNPSPSLHIPLLLISSILSSQSLVLALIFVLFLVCELILISLFPCFLS